MLTQEYFEIDTYSFILGAIYATGFAFISGCLLIYLNKRKRRKKKYKFNYHHGISMPHTKGNIMYPSIRQPTPQWLKDLEQEKSIEDGTYR